MLIQGNNYTKKILTLLPIVAVIVTVNRDVGYDSGQQHKATFIISVDLCRERDKSL